MLVWHGRGYGFGEYTFATIALCFATAVSKTPVQLQCLERKMAESWEERYRGGYEKFYHRHISVTGILDYLRGLFFPNNADIGQKTVHERAQK